VCRDCGNVVVWPAHPVALSPFTIVFPFSQNVLPEPILPEEEKKEKKEGIAGALSGLFGK
jgi:hypothetical protein